MFLVSVAVRVSVRFFTSLRELTGKREETLEFSGKEKITIGLVLERLSKRYGREFVDYVFDRKTGEVKGFLQFLVNGRSASTLNGLDTPLRDGDVLAIVPPVGGG
ncbi:MAG: MoaD family protein [Candidatus Bathyarchaeia archaeon]